jgi:uncharacterized membrane protein YgdD (TMEM256/DUF423 family)
VTTRRIFIFVGLLGALAVMLGAFGAHGIQSWAGGLADGADRLRWWDTGSKYLFYALPLLVALGIVESRAPSRWSAAGVWLTLGGLCLFSGSLFVMTFTGIKVLGAVTPFGGVALIGAWICVALGAARMR